jgi:hypothetical protein
VVEIALFSFVLAFSIWTDPMESSTDLSEVSMSATCRTFSFIMRIADIERMGVEPLVQWEPVGPIRVPMAHN